MGHVLSLIAARPEDRLFEADVGAVAARMAQIGAQPGELRWLSPGEACDLAFHGPAAAVLSAAREMFAGRRLDLNVVPVANRRKRLLVADMDSTIIRQECIDELAAEIGVAGEVSEITERAMRGELSFEPALRARVGLLQGLPIDAIETVLRERITFVPGAATLVATMRQAGAYTALVSGGFKSFTVPVGRMLQFHEERANTLLEADGRLTGTLADPILGRSAKAEALIELSSRLGLEPARSVAVGDGANDLDMIRAAGLGVAFHAKPALKAAADAVVDHCDLRAVLFLQGYAVEEFAPVPDIPSYSAGSSLSETKRSLL